MSVRVLYLMLRRLVSLLALRRRPRFELEAEIIVLRHQLDVVSRQVERPRFDDGDRAILTALSAVIARQRWSAFLVRPDTVLGWHRRLVARRHRPSPARRPGRPRTEPAVEALVLRLAEENPSWGYRRIHGELLGLGIVIAASTVWSILRRNGVSPAPRHRASTWAKFLRVQAHNIVSCDFFTVDTITLRRLHVIVFIHHATREILHIAVTDHPNARFVTQQARNLLIALDEHGMTIRFLIRDRGGTFAGDLFDTVFTTSDIDVVLTPFRTPQANGICERVIGTIRREALDHVLILGPGHLRRVLREYVDHYNDHRPHRSLGQLAPNAPADPDAEPLPPPARIERRDVLGGLIHQYSRAA